MNRPIEKLDDLAMQADITYDAAKSMCASRIVQYVGVKEFYDQLKGIMNQMQSRVQKSPDVALDERYKPKAVSERLKGDKTFKSFETMYEAVRYYHKLLQEYSSDKIASSTANP